MSKKHKKTADRAGYGTSHEDGDTSDLVGNAVVLPATDSIATGGGPLGDLDLSEGRDPDPHAVAAALGLDPDNPDHEHLASWLIEAVDVFRQRNHRHGADSRWRIKGWQGNLFHMRDKAERLWHEFMVADEQPDDLDSAIDLINYTLFFLVCYSDNDSGTWGWQNNGA